MVKKLFLFTTLLLLCFTGIHAQEFTSGYLTYHVTDTSQRTVEVAGYTDAMPEEAVVPSTVSNDDIEYTVTAIGKGAFAHSFTVTHITLPEGITTIKNVAFLNCILLQQVNIPDSVTSIGQGAFMECYKLSDIHLPEGLTIIEPETFHACKALTKVNLPSSVQRIAYSAFSACTSLSEVNLPDNLANIEHNAFSSTALKSVVIPSSIFSIEKEAFSFCRDLTEVIYTVSSTHDFIASIEEFSFYQCTSLKRVVLHNNILKIANNAFSECNSLSEICAWPATPPTLETDVFKNVPRNLSLIVPIGSSEAYQTADTWKEFTNIREEDAPLSEITEGPLKFRVTNFRNLIVSGYTDQLPAKLTINPTVIRNEVEFTATSISDAAFTNSILSEIHIPKEITDISPAAFSNCPTLQNIFVSTENPNYSDLNGVLYSKDGTSILRYPTGRQEPSFTIPEHVTSIGYAAFLTSEHLTEISIPENVTIIDGQAFSECKKLSNVNIPNSVTEIGYAAFSSCPSLKDINIPDGIPAIRHSTFQDCSSLSQIRIPDSVTKIETEAFSACTALTQITIPDSVTEIEDMAFFACSNLSGIAIGNSVKTIGDMAFFLCENISEIIVWPLDPPTLLADAFFAVPSDIPVLVPEGTLGDYMASDWSYFTNLQENPSSSVSELTFPEDIRCADGMLLNPQGRLIRVYDLTGRLAYSGRDTARSFPTGIYVVRCGDTAIKMAL